jgi:hypothetical protein
LQIGSGVIGMGLHPSKWLKSLPRGRYLLLGFVVAVLPLLINLAGGAGAIRLFCLTAARDFAAIQPFNLIPLYIDSYLACDYNAQIDHYNCGPARLYQPLRPVGALLVTGATILRENGWSQALALIMGLAFGYFLSLALLKRLFGLGEANLFTVIGAALLTPVAGSLGALLLQGVAVALFYLLGTMIGAIIFLLSFLAVPIRIARTIRETEDAARHIQTLHEMTNDPKPPGPA